MDEQTRTGSLYAEARAIVREHDRMSAQNKELLLRLPPLYLIEWCRASGMLRVAHVNHHLNGG